MLEKIEYLFPKNEKNKEFFDLLSTLFTNIPYVANKENKEIQIGTSNLNPITIYKLDHKAKEVQLMIGEQKELNLLNKNSTFENVYQIKKLPIQEVKQKLAGHITRVDHTGVNLPTNLYSQKEWNYILHYFASHTNLYHYPTGELWPFAIPATKKENEEEITDFDLIREPKFELCYEEYETNVTLHLDLETDLSKAEVESLFPQEQGVYFETLEHVYKAIYLDYEENINIRIDVRFKSERGDFESGKWLVLEGKRIR